MSLKRGGFVLQCDGCGERHYLDEDDFEAAKEAANEFKEQNNWTVVQRRGRYADLCNSCT